MLLTKDNFYVYAVGYSGLCMDHTRSFIFANCIDDAIYQFSAINYQDEGMSYINVSMIAKAVQFFSNYLCFCAKIIYLHQSKANIEKYWIKALAHYNRNYK